MRRKYFFFIISLALALAVTACQNDIPSPRNFPVTQISISKTSLALNLWTDDDYDFTTESLAVTIQPEEANKAVLWGSSNPNVATVVNGLVTAVAEGSAAITAIAKNGGHMAVCSVLVVNQAPGPVAGVSIPNSLTLYLGGANQQTLTPAFTTVFVTNETVIWSISPSGVATVAGGVVTAVGAGTATITVSAAGGFEDTCVVTVTPLLAQFGSIAAFMTAGNAYYKPGFDFGTSPAGDSASNTSTWTGTNTNHQDFVINYTYNYNQFGKAGAGNLVPVFNPQAPANQVPTREIPAALYRSHTQFNDAAIAHYAFTGFRQAHPWGISSLTPAPPSMVQNKKNTATSSFV